MKLWYRGWIPPALRPLGRRPYRHTKTSLAGGGSVFEDLGPLPQLFHPSTTYYAASRDNRVLVRSFRIQMHNIHRRACLVRHRSVAGALTTRYYLIWRFTPSIQCFTFKMLKRLSTMNS